MIIHFTRTKNKCKNKKAERTKSARPSSHVRVVVQDPPHPGPHPADPRRLTFTLTKRTLWVGREGHKSGAVFSTVLPCSLQPIPLHGACKEGHADLVTMLLKFHANVKATDEDGHNCLNIAIMAGQKYVTDVKRISCGRKRASVSSSQGYRKPVGGGPCVLPYDLVYSCEEFCTNFGPLNLGGSIMQGGKTSPTSNNDVLMLLSDTL